MKILLVNQTFYPDAVATAQHLTDLAVALKNSGHDVTVMASRRGYSEPHPIYSASEIYQGIRIIRVWPFMFGRKNKLTRAIDALCVNFAFFVRMLFLPRADTVIALTSPPLVSFFSCLVGKLKKSCFVYWVMDMNPDEAIAMRWLRETSWIAQLLKKCQSFVVKNSARIIVLDEFMKVRLMLVDSRLSAKMPARLVQTVCAKGERGNDSDANNLKKGLANDKIVVIPPWSHDGDLEAVRHEDNPFRVSHGLQDKFVVMYSGNHSVCHPLNTVLKAAQLLAKDESFIFIFIGGGARVQDVTEFKNKNALKNIIQMDYVARSEIKFSLSAADLHLVVMGDNMVGIVHPCKVYGILALGKPFAYVGPEQSHITDLMREGAVGSSVRHGEADKLVRMIQESQNKTKVALDDIGEKNRKLAETFSAKVLIPKLVAEFEKGEKSPKTQGPGI